MTKNLPHSNTLSEALSQANLAIKDKIIIKTSTGAFISSEELHLPIITENIEHSHSNAPSCEKIPQF